MLQLLVITIYLVIVSNVPILECPANSERGNGDYTMSGHHRTNQPTLPTCKCIEGFAMNENGKCIIDNEWCNGPENCKQNQQVCCRFAPCHSEYKQRCVPDRMSCLHRHGCRGLRSGVLVPFPDCPENAVKHFDDFSNPFCVCNEGFEMNFEQNRCKNV